MPARFESLPEYPHVALVTIDRPERANSLDPPTLRELAAAWRRIAADDAIRCAVLTGAGERIFCAGMDMKTTIPASQRLARGERLDAGDFEGLRDAATAVLAGFDLGKPLVCAINGHCRAVGLDLMLASELRFAVPHATFALEEVARGLYPTGNATVLLPRQIAWVHAMDLMLTARPISASRAAEIGSDQRGRRARGAVAARARGGRRDRRERAARRARDACRRARAARAAARRRVSAAGGARSSAAQDGRRRGGRARVRGEAQAGMEGAVSALADRLRAWPERLAALAREFRVPGASLAVMAGDDVFATACGVLNVRTGVEATPDSVFQMGSITKVWTTTLVMQLVDEGRLDLDARVAELLPEFGLADAEAARAITLRQLLTHTSGIDGDQFADTGRGDDAIERFVAYLHGVGCVHAPGARFSYCNAGFVVAGRLVEVLRGAPTTPCCASNPEAARLARDRDAARTGDPAPRRRGPFRSCRRNAPGGAGLVAPALQRAGRRDAVHDRDELLGFATHALD